MQLLLLQHAERKNTGHILSYCEERNIQVDVVKMWEQNVVIPTATDYDGVIVLGGTMNVHDEFPFLAKEEEFIKAFLHKVPMLGICLGAQLIAHALGAPVRPDSDQREVGFDVVTLTPEGIKHSLFSGFPERISVMQWHGQTFGLPDGATLLASSTVCKNQAFAHGNAYGVQFHLEVSSALGREIYEEGRNWVLEHRNGLSFNEEKFLSDLDTYEPVIKEQCYQLLDNFLNLNATKK